MLMATNITSRSIFLMWVEPHDNSAPIQSYLIEYMQPSFFMGDRARNITTVMEEAFITGLIPGVTYSFTVTAINEIGMSPSSEPFNITTPEAGQCCIKVLIA